MTATPVAAVVSVTELAHTRLVVVACPYCRRRHTHGWPWTDPDVGARNAHCDRLGNYYRVRAAA